ncbi:hypothetical protein BX666DRAFT_1864948 [Dichotomocladium elegans]|nr:hypothetical protein BX666DRAFT_1864948 [Dichotomocladium elegans]
MQPTLIRRAAHKPLIQFIGSRVNLWKGKWVLILQHAAPHSGPHPLTPPNLEKHVAKASPVPPAPAAKAKNASSKGAIEFSELPARYRRAPMSEIEMEAIESGGATFIF